MSDRLLEKQRRRMELHALKNAIGSHVVCSVCEAPSSKVKITGEDQICTRCRPRLKEILAQKAAKERADRLEEEQIKKRMSERALTLKNGEGSW